MITKLLEDKNIIVVGGAGLLGSKICNAIVEAGSKCAIVDISIDHLNLVADNIQRLYGERPFVMEASIIDKDSIDSVIDYCSKKMGKIDALVNTAYPRNENYGRRFEDVTYKDFCENVNLHLGGYFLTSQRILEYFKSNGGGCLLNMSSIYGINAPRFDIYNKTSMTMPVEYAAVKSAIIHLTKYLAKYYKGNGIRVNALSLGGLLDRQPEEFISAYNNYCIDKGMLDPLDIVGTIVFLLSDKSRYINGQNITVDDGFTL